MGEIIRPDYSPGIYVHIPFCKTKCIYCDFFSGGFRDDFAQSYVHAILNEYKFRRNELSVVPDTLYFGGGTPSLLSCRDFSKLTRGIGEISDTKGKWREFTIEVNPDDVSEDKCLCWKDCGVNRISIGIQSFNDKELLILGRRHDSKKAIKAIEMIRNYFDNISIDLMFALPGQTLEGMRSNLEVAISLQPEHISSYWLTIEEKTPLGIMVEKNIIIVPDEREGLGIWRMINDTLSQSEYHHYEISNYARSGREACHNYKYWMGVPYLGLGVSAHSYDGKLSRKSNPMKLKEYVSHYSEEGNTPFYVEEVLSQDDLHVEFIMTRLRTSSGINLKEYYQKFGMAFYSHFMEKSNRFIKSRDMGKDDQHIYLTEKGMMISDHIFVALI